MSPFWSELRKAAPLLPIRICPSSRGKQTYTCLAELLNTPPSATASHNGLGNVTRRVGAHGRLNEAVVPGHNRYPRPSCQHPAGGHSPLKSREAIEMSPIGNTTYRLVQMYCMNAGPFYAHNSSGHMLPCAETRVLVKLVQTERLSPVQDLSHPLRGGQS